MSLFLAGMSFVIALLALIIAVAEHQRAQRAEEKIARAFNAWSDDVTKLALQGAEQAELIAKLASADITLDQMIRAVAAASTPPATPVGQVHIVVPGPRTLQ